MQRRSRGFRMKLSRLVSVFSQHLGHCLTPVQQNILFGAPFDEERYKKVIYQCSLERDLTLFNAGDEAEVGEKGLTLSGGQKARITLARAVYSKADILLLDDVLAALEYVDTFSGYTFE